MQFYIDESGNLAGDKFFCFSVLVTQKNKRLINLVKKFRKKWGTGSPLKELKGSETSPSAKIAFFNDLNKEKDFKLGYLIVLNAGVSEAILRDKNLAYNYLLSFLIEACVKDNFTEPCLIFNLDNHDVKVKSRNSFADYIKIKAYSDWGYTGKIIVCYWDSEKNNLIQIADLVSNTVFQRYEKSKVEAFDKLLFEYVIKFPYRSF